MTYIRRPAVSGSFYPADKKSLLKMLGELVPNVPSEKKESAVAVLSPHAGYMYSGSVTGELFSHLIIPEDVIIFCFSHRPISTGFALSPMGEWLTPLGSLQVSEELCEVIKSSHKLVKYDEESHRCEHSGEVQLPFLKYLRDDVKIAVVALNLGLGKRDIELLKEFGKNLALALKDRPKKTLVVASSDFNHYESNDITYKKDMLAIQQILDLNEDGFCEAIKKHDISVCGFAPIITMISYSKGLSAKKACLRPGRLRSKASATERFGRQAQLVVHKTSGDVTGAMSEVVGYAAIAIF